MIWIKRLSLALASTLLTLALVELGMRLLDVAPARWAHPNHLESDDKRHAVDMYPDDPRGYFDDLRSESVLARLAANGLSDARARAEATPRGITLRFSAELCRGPDIPPKEGLRTLAVGDSFTEGQGVREVDTWPEVLETLGGNEVINCGRRGHDFPQIRERFERLSALQPDRVVYAMTLNDAQQSESFHARQDFLNDWITDRRRMIGDVPKERSFWSSRIWAFVEERNEARRVGEETTRWYREMYGEPNAEGWRATLEHIEAMHERVDGQLVVAIWPLFVDLEGEYPFAEVHETIREAVRARGIPVVDTLDAFRGEATERLWVHATDHHPNERAHSIFARAVHEALE